MIRGSHHILNCPRLDLLHAVIFDSPLIITSVDSSTTSSSPHANGSLRDSEVFARLLPLLLAEQEDFHTMAPTAHQANLSGLSDLLQGAAAAIRSVLVDETALDNRTGRESALQCFRLDLERFSLLNCSAVPDAGDVSHLARACHSTMMLFYNVIRNRFDGHVPTQTLYVDDLFAAVRQVKDSAWTDVPYLRLLM